MTRGAFGRFVIPWCRVIGIGEAISKPRDDRQKDLLLPALDQIIDLGHPLVRLAALIDWKFLDERFSVNRPFNCGLLSSHFLFLLPCSPPGTAVALAPLELVGVAETGRARLTYDCSLALDRPGLLMHRWGHGPFRGRESASR
ncbi:hypothetical protein [Bradyrhizobium liaoningense]